MTDGSVPAVQTVKAGRDLDALVAEKVMGWLNCRRYLDNFSGIVCPEFKPGENIGDLNGDTEVIPKYSTDISSAWAVVEKLVEMRVFPGVSFSEEHPTWVCSLVKNDGDPLVIEADTMPVAVCVAALELVGVRVEAVE